MHPITDLNHDALTQMAADPDRGPVAMLNLLKFKPDGAESFARYSAAAWPMVEKRGGRVIYAGDCGELVIGSEDWDLLVVVEYPTAGDFADLMLSAEYQAVAPLRQQALVRSVLYETRPAAFANAAD